MQAQESLTGIPLTELGQPVAELPVRDVERAQDHYRDKLGFRSCGSFPADDGEGKEPIL